MECNKEMISNCLGAWIMNQLPALKIGEKAISVVYWSVVWCGAVWCGVLQCGVVCCSVVWYAAVWCRMLHYSVV